jgi:hypothetical protein
MTETLGDREEVSPRYSNLYHATNVIEYVQEVEVIPKINRIRTFSYHPYETISPQNIGSLWRQFSRLNDAYQNLKSLKDEGIMDENTMREIIKQKVFLEDNLDQLQGHSGYVVACDSKLFFDDTLDAAIKKAKDTVGKRPYYSESLNNFIDYPSPLL